MEEKKFDLNSIIGFILIFAIFGVMMYFNQPTEEEIQAEKEKQEQEKIATEQNNEQNKTTDFVKESETIAVDPQDSLAMIAAKSQLGAFAYAASLPSAKDLSLIHI